MKKKLAVIILNWNGRKLLERFIPDAAANTIGEEADLFVADNGSTDDSLEWLRASASMPLVTRPVKVGGRVLLDGGISDSIPLKHFQDMGFDRNVVVLTRPRSYRKEPTKLWPYRLLMRRYPAITQAMARRHKMYNSQLDYVEREEQAGRIFVIAPEHDLPIGRVEMNVEKMNAVYNIGRETATALLPRLKEFLQG